jgi:hypothetical protein
MNDNKTDRMRLWFEWLPTNEIHMDSLNPATGGQVPFTCGLQAWVLLTKLILKGGEHQAQMNDMPEDHRCWMEGICDRMKQALHAVVDSDNTKMKDVGLRTSWTDEEKI